MIWISKHGTLMFASSILFCILNFTTFPKQMLILIDQLLLKLSGLQQN